MPSNQLTQEQSVARAWQVLKKARQPIQMPFKAGKQLAATTGYIPRQAVEQLTSDGWDNEQAQQMVKAAIEQNFPKFAASWQSYVVNSGVASDLLAMPEEQCIRLLDKAGLKELEPFLRQIQQQGPMVIASPAVVMKLGLHSAEFRDKKPGGILHHVLIEHYGMPEQQVRAVLADCEKFQGCGTAVLIACVLLTGCLIAWCP